MSMLITIRKTLMVLAGLLIIGMARAEQTGPIRKWTPEEQAKVVEEARQGWWKEAAKTKDERLDWWRKARFGCFIHWNATSLPAGQWKGKNIGGYAEHLQRQCRITQDEYREEIIKKFDPQAFDAQQWAKMIRDAGMKYVVITSKHHDGFAMYDSKASDYTIVKATPYGKDPMRDLADACRQENLRFGFYYSHAFDWGEPTGVGNDWEFERPGGDRKLYGSEWWETKPELVAEVHENYVLKKAIPQIQELITGYQPDILWFDTPHKLPPSENLLILKKLREASTSVVVNGRIIQWMPEGSFGDYLSTGDRADDFRGGEKDWEVIPTTNESYGYSIHDKNYKTAAYLVQLIARAASLNGNVLLNIAPKGDGTICAEDTAILKGLGAWFKVYGDAIYETAESGLPQQYWGVTTAKGNTLYLHVFDWPKNGKLVLGGVQGQMLNAQVMGRCNDMPTVERNGDDLIVCVAEQAPNPIDSVIELTFKSEFTPVDRPQILAQEHPQELRIFRAEAVGGNVSYADGKWIPSRNQDRRYASGWAQDDTWFRWKTRLLSPQRYRVSARYNAEKEMPEGVTGVLMFGDQVLRFQPQKDPDSGPTIQDVGVIDLPAGDVTVEWRCEGLQGSAAIQPIMIKLIPISE